MIVYCVINPLSYNCHSSLSSPKLDEADVINFDQGFKYLGVTFLRSMIMVPFDRPKKERRVLYYPPPLNMAAYYLKKKRGW